LLQQEKKMKRAEVNQKVAESRIGKEFLSLCEREVAMNPSISLAIMPACTPATTASAWFE
jgi:hypothetical protein